VRSGAHSINSANAKPGGRHMHSHQHRGAEDQRFRRGSVPIAALSSLGASHLPTGSRLLQVGQWMPGPSVSGSVPGPPIARRSAVGVSLAPAAGNTWPAEAVTADTSRPPGSRRSSPEQLGTSPLALFFGEERRNFFQEVVLPLQLTQPCFQSLVFAGSTGSSGLPSPSALPFTGAVPSVSTR
jgi:hypothetical protein